MAFEIGAVIVCEGPSAHPDNRIDGRDTPGNLSRGSPMTFDLYIRTLDGLSYAVHSTAHRRDTRNAPELINIRDAFACAYPEFQARYVPAGDR